MDEVEWLIPLRVLKDFSTVRRLKGVGGGGLRTMVVAERSRP